MAEKNIKKKVTVEKVPDRIIEKKSDYDILVEFIDQIKHLEYRILETSEKVAFAERELDNAILKMKDEIANEVDGNGKPLYSNDMKRQAALLEKKEDDGMITQLEDDIQEFKHDIAADNIELKYQKNLFEIHKLAFKGPIEVE